MSDHNLLSTPVTGHGFLSAGQTQNNQILDKTFSWPDNRCLAERAVVYVDCSLARSGYTGKRWFAQINAEGEQRHRDFLSVQAARKAFGVEIIPLRPDSAGYGGAPMKKRWLLIFLWHASETWEVFVDSPLLVFFSGVFVGMAATVCWMFVEVLPKC